MNLPIQFQVDVPKEMARVHVLIRLLLLVALGSVGFSSLYSVAYLAVPAVAALVIAQRGREHYLGSDGPRIARVLQWLAGFYAYLWLLTDSVPSTESPGPARLEVHPTGQPTATSALTRLLTSVPAVIVLVLLSLVSCLLWMIGAIAILIVRRTPTFVSDFLATTLRYQFRLIGYHFSLVDGYPSLEEAHLTQVSSSGPA